MRVDVHLQIILVRHCEQFAMDAKDKTACQASSDEFKLVGTRRLGDISAEGCRGFVTSLTGINWWQ